MNRVLLRRIVCAVDLSDRSVPSLKRALQLHGAPAEELVKAAHDRESDLVVVA